MERQILSFKDFVKKIQCVKEAISIKNDVRYSEIICNESHIDGIRESTNKPFKIDTHKLYDAYKTLIYPEEVNTITIKKYVGFVASPSYAILIASKIYD